ncbi:Transthyretin-like family-containing protein [Strongyloides ratti]|uniref:Transthyretin-like family-containing protein n=1 Tax=Strongyloides ratti TaxID=34506 RepID=A0A090KZ66_STRRB|nr:Transthyretin-like family-containing protein [Strongyloides ratti]CEF60529.1 Transthyretin-like family-containing protein [Strongyloides ratti]
MGKVKKFVNGQFIVYGQAKELFKIVPFLYIYHQCVYDSHNCIMRITKYIPSRYVASDNNCFNAYDLGYIELSKSYYPQKLICNTSIKKSKKEK